MEYSMIQNTKIVVGEGCSKKLGTVLKEEGYHKAFIVYDRGIAKAGLLEDILKSVVEAGVDYASFGDVETDPPSEIVDRAALLCKDSKCDCVVAVGGGSSIDTAKGVNILRFNEGSILDYGKPGVSMNKCPGLIVISTTSGTGSELSDGLIISDLKNNVKVPILANNAMSEIAFIDPELTVSLPIGITVATGLDVFSHAFESYTSIRANMMTQPISEKIMAMVVENLPILVNDPTNMEARSNMAVASTLAGWMLAQAGAHIGHSLAHVLGAHLHIVHGEACAYGLPGVMEVIHESREKELRYVGSLLGISFNKGDSSIDVASKTAQAYKSFVYDTLKLKTIDSYGPIDAEYVNTVCYEAVLNEPFRGLSPTLIDGVLVHVLLDKAIQ